MPPRGVKRNVTPEKPAASPALLQALLPAAAAILMLSLFSGEIRDTDIWLHLKTGQHTLETRALTVPDPFSYTSAMGSGYAGEDVTRYFNLTHEWLAQIVMYLIYTATGFPGLVLARALMLIVFCGLVGWMAFRRTNGFYISLAAALAAAGVAFHFQQSRPFRRWVLTTRQPCRFDEKREVVRAIRLMEKAGSRLRDHRRKGSSGWPRS